MKKNLLVLLLLVSFAGFSQDFEKDWEKVYEYEYEGKIKSATEEVEKIYKTAKKKKIEAQIIKTFFYKSKFLLEVDENAQTKILANLSDEIRVASIPSKAILQTMYADFLESYVKKNNYSLKNRTDVDSSGSNIKLWTKKHFYKKIEELYSQNSKNERILRKTSLKNYEAVFESKNFSNLEKMSVYDYVRNSEIDFFTYLIQQNYYETTSKILLETAYSIDAFRKASFDSIPNETILKLVTIYQDIENKSPDDIELILKRTRNLHNLFFKDNHRYLKFLNQIQKQTNDEAIIEGILLKKATFYSNLSSDDQKSQNQNAVQALDSILKNKINATIYNQALALKNKITLKYLDIQCQSIAYEKENMRAFLRFKNIDTLSMKFFKIPRSINAVQNRIERDSLVLNFIKDKKAFIESKTALPKTPDFEETSTEILLPNLELGNYAVIFQSDNKPLTLKNIKYNFILITNIVAAYSSDDKNNTFQIIHRKTGLPIENASVKIDNQEKTTDKKGVAFFDNNTFSSTNYSALFSYEKDSLEIRHYDKKTYFPYSEDIINSEYSSKATIFTDRAIYRPGQKVYGKGIMLEKKNGQENVMANASVYFEILDPDHGTLKEFNVKTNEFGSFTFEYDIPKNSKTGEFTIEVTEFSNADSYRNNYIDSMEDRTRTFHFNVEEYKRPTFEISFDKIEKDYLLNENIAVNGKALAFSKNSISGAVVKYKITKNKKSTNNRENVYTEIDFPIETGEVRTDSEGKFAIHFKATTENDVDSLKLPLYEFQIDVTVTDLNGETQTQRTSINAGFHTLILNSELPRRMDVLEKNTVSLKSENLNGTFKPVKGKIEFFLTEESKPNLKQRLFEYPEIQSISEEQFGILFPYETKAPLNDTVKISPKLTYSKNVDTQIEKEIALDFLSNVQPGGYKIVFTAIDELGHTIVDTQHFSIYNSEDANAKLIVAKQLNINPKKDGFVLLKLKTKIPELYVDIETYVSSKTIYQKDLVLLGKEKILKIPIAPSIENDLLIKISSFFENEAFEERVIVKLEKIFEKFDVETITLRSKIEPGKKETWSFKINSDGKQNTAEVLATMYDYSLDQFKAPHWQDLKTIPRYYNYGLPKKYYGKSNTTYTRITNLNPYLYFKPIDESTKLKTFGFSFTKDYYVKNDYFNKLKIKLRNFKKPGNPQFTYGYVSDEIGPLPGASIQILGTTKIVQSDIDGFYEIETVKGDTLVFTYTGYENQKVAVNTNKIDVNLLEGDDFNEVVVTAYGVMRETKELTYAAKVYDSSDKTSPFNNDTEIVLRGYKSLDGTQTPLLIVDGAITKNIDNLNPENISSVITLNAQKATGLYGSEGKNGALIITTKSSLQELSKVQTRTNFNETAFFFPQIKTDKNGNFSFNFTSPEALTQWKLRIFAHNKKAVSGYLESLVVTQKDFMVVPNLPRFLREKDSIIITSKISNLTSEAKSGMALLQLFDAVSMEPVDAKMLNSNHTKSFKVDAKGNTSVSWKIYVPEGLQGVQYKIVAKAGNFSDGEENILPVLTNSMLVTESIPVWVRENSTKEYTFENLKNNTSSTLRNQQLTLEYTSNPTWLAIQSLPYLMEYEHECAEQTFARYYANALASEILNSNPKIAEVFESWKKSDRPISKLQQNEELKSILLAETPWIADAENEEQKKKMLATLFDLQKMKDSQKTILEKLTQKQNPSGGFAWFDGGEENVYVTRHIISGLGHLQKLSKIATGDFDKITQKGVSYMDQKFIENHKSTEALNKSQKLLWNYPYDNLHYLYARSFYFEKYPLPESTLLITKKYTENIKENWLQYSLYEKGLASLVLSRFGEKQSAKKILESLRQTSSNNEDWGMYWIENKAGWYWYQAPIETQALLIEAFAEIENDKKSIDAMKVWLLKNKQNKNWPTTKATTEAVYALLMQGTDWISVKDKTVIKLGNEKIITKKLAENEKEAGTGYIKMTWKTDEISKEMATVSVNNKSEVPGFGGFYWQYLEDLDKIKTSQASVMNVEKGLYLKATTSNGDQLQRITSTKPLKIGDLVTVRLIITTTEDMEFVHLKDRRASCFEPIDVLSGNNYKDGLRFYKSTKDIATHFFFDEIKKGTYVLEYDIRVNNLGDFSNGITTIQSMYAPEFSSHTKGIRVKIEE